MWTRSSSPGAARAVLVRTWQERDERVCWPVRRSGLFACIELPPWAAPLAAEHAERARGFACSTGGTREGAHVFPIALRGQSRTRAGCEEAPCRRARPPTDGEAGRATSVVHPALPVAPSRPGRGRAGGRGRAALLDRGHGGLEVRMGRAEPGAGGGPSMWRRSSSSKDAEEATALLDAWEGRQAARSGASARTGRALSWASWRGPAGTPIGDVAAFRRCEAHEAADPIGSGGRRPCSHSAQSGAATGKKRLPATRLRRPSTSSRSVAARVGPNARRASSAHRRPHGARRA